jgi:hypothetical protein
LPVSPDVRSSHGVSAVSFTDRLHVTLGWTVWPWVDSGMRIITRTKRASGRICSTFRLCVLANKSPRLRVVTGAAQLSHALMEEELRLSLLLPCSFPSNRPRCLLQLCPRSTGSSRKGTVESPDPFGRTVRQIFFSS